MPDGTRFGPVDLATLGNWAAQGRLSPATQITDTQTGRRFAASEHVFLRNRIPRAVLAVSPKEIDTGNTSGENGAVPRDIPTWNWAAFGFTLNGLGFLWLFSQRIYLEGALMLGFMVFRLTQAQFLPPEISGDVARIGTLVLFGLGIYLGFRGNHLAWKRRGFQDMEDFRACQGIWGWWSLALWIASTVAYFVVKSMLDRMQE